jgi:hypothetical protein
MVNAGVAAIIRTVVPEILIIMIVISIKILVRVAIMVGDIHMEM